jgi:AbiV family abortive infection protein
MEVYEIFKKLVRTENNLIQSSDELDAAIDHIVQLLTDAANLFLQGSYATAAFLSITACEEVAKAHIGSFTDGQHPEKAGRNMFFEITR